MKNLSNHYIFKLNHIRSFFFLIIRGEQYGKKYIHNFFPHTDWHQYLPRYVTASLKSIFLFIFSRNRSALCPIFVGTNWATCFADRLNLGFDAFKVTNPLSYNRRGVTFLVNSFLLGGKWVLHFHFSAACKFRSCFFFFFLNFTTIPDQNRYIALYTILRW